IPPSTLFALTIRESSKAARSNPHWTKVATRAKQPAGLAADQVRAGHQSNDRQGNRAENPGILPPARRRGDRIVVMFAAARMSLPGKWPLGRDVRDHGETPRVSRPPAQHRRGAKFDQSLGFS